MKHITVFAMSFAFATLVAAPVLFASGDHGSDGGMKHGMSGSSSMMPMAATLAAVDYRLTEQKEVDGYNVTIQVMKAKAGSEMGGSHDFMIKVEQNSQAVADLSMNTKVVHPNGSAETKATMKMGEWYMVGYDLGHAGKHQLMFQFKTADGVKHNGGIYYSGS